MQEVQPAHPTPPPESVHIEVGTADKSLNWRQKKTALLEKENPTQEPIERPFRAVPAVSQKPIPEKMVLRAETTDQQAGAERSKVPGFRRVSRAE